MSLNIVFVIVYFIEMLIATIFFNGISQRKKPLPVIMILGTLIFQIGSLLQVLGLGTAWVNVTFSFLATLLTPVLFFNLNFKKSVLYSVVLVALSVILETSIVLIISSLSSLYVNDYQTDITLLFFEIVISKLLYFIFTMVLQKFIKKDSDASKIPFVFYIFPTITLIAVSCICYISLNQYVEFKNQLILAGVSVLLFFATLFVFFMFQANAQKENRLLLLQQEQDKIKTDMTYYEILNRQNINLREYAHDAKNHISAIKSLNNDPEIDSYISKMLESLEAYSNVSHSGNRILDVIIDKYVTESNINNIKFAYDIKNNNLIGLEYHDTVTVLGNLLDNAIEAASKSQEKKVALETDFKNEYSVIIVSNSCDAQPSFDSTKTPVTSKKNKALHGFGLKSVKKTIKKYDGDLEFNFDETANTFTVTIMLNFSA